MNTLHIKKLCLLQDSTTELQFFADPATDSVLVSGPPVLPHITIYRASDKYTAINDLTGETVTAAHPVRAYQKAVQRWWLKPLREQKYKQGATVRVRFGDTESTGTVKNFYPATGCNFLPPTEREASYDIAVNGRLLAVPAKHILGRA